ncbi:MAG: hypothetical protein ABFQ62_05150 [Patescibacteria group bacterium]
MISNEYDGLFNDVFFCLNDSSHEYHEMVVGILSSYDFNTVAAAELSSYWSDITKNTTLVRAFIEIFGDNGRE